MAADDSSPSSPTRFLDSVFDSFKEKLNEEYSRFMDKHVDAISSELNRDEYTPDYGKIESPVSLPKKRWIITSGIIHSSGNCSTRSYITNFGDLIFEHYPWQPIILPEFKTNYPLPNVLIDFIKFTLYSNSERRHLKICEIAEHYYKKFTQYKPLFSSGKLIEYDVLLSENTTFKAENERFKTRIIELESVIQILNDKNDENETTLKTIEDKLRETMTYVQRLEAIIDKNEDEIETLKRKIYKVECSCDEFKVKEEDYLQTIASKTVVNESLLKDKNLLSRENRVLNAEKAELETAKSGLIKTNCELEILKNVLIEDKSKYLTDLDVLKEKHKTELHELYLKNKKLIEETNNYLIQLETMRNESRHPDGRTYRVLYEELVSKIPEKKDDEDPITISKETKPRIVLESMVLKEEWWVGLQKSMSFRGGKTPIKINDKPFLGSDLLVYTTDTKNLVGRLVYDYSRSILELIEM